MRLIVGVLLLLGWCAAASLHGRSPAAGPRLGINLAGPADWSTELPFVDVFRLARPWISQKQGAKWGEGPPLDLDEHGWVRSLPPGCAAETTMLTDLHGHYPRGRYTILYDGTGRFEIGHGHKVVEDMPGRMIVEVDPARGNLWLRVEQTDPADYLRNFRVIMPGFEATYRSNPWHPAFLRRWTGFACLRFMDFMRTNGSDVKTWDDRPKMADATWTRGVGVPVEMLCDLANRLGIDPWFCMPHQADNDYVRQFAVQVKQLLQPQRKVYIEYSNEVWNGAFPQCRYAGQEGLKLGFADKPWEAAWKYTGHRSRQIFAIWEEVFAGRERLIRVLATQAVNPFVTRRVVEQDEAYKHADAIAIAPYMWMNVAAKDADAVAALGVEGVLDKLEAEGLQHAVTSMRRQKEVADELGLRLICYEAGQHLVGVGDASKHRELEQVLRAANAHPRMGELYHRYYAAWEEIGGDVMAVFSSVGRWSKWGSWGLMEYGDLDPMAQPKMRATMEQARAWGQNVTLP